MSVDRVKVQANKEYYVPFFQATKEISLEPQKVEIMKGIEDFRFARS